MQRLFAAFLALLSFEINAFAAAPAIPPSAPTPPVYNWTDQSGGLRVSQEAPSPTYDVDTLLFQPAATPTDVFAIFPSQNQAASTIFVQRVEVSCVASTSAAGLTVRFQQTSSVNIATGTLTSLTAGNGFLTKRDVNAPSTIAAAQYWTANPTTRNGVSSSRFLIDEQEMLCSTGTVSAGTDGKNVASITAKGTSAVWDYSTARTQTGVLQWGSQGNTYLAVNLNGQTLPTGFYMRVQVTWVEVKKLTTCMLGDSTTALATLGYLNGGSSYAGGMGKQGSLDGLTNVYNYGNNGFRTVDYLNNLNSVTWPISNVQGNGIGSPATTTNLQTGNYWQNCDIAVVTYGINDIRAGLIGVDLASMTNRLTSLIDTLVNATLNGATLGGSYTSSAATSYSVTAASVATATATFTGTQTGTTLTTSSVTGTIYPGSTVTGGSGAAETIVAYGTGSGGAGTYTVSVSQTETATGSSYASVTLTISGNHQFSTVGSGETYQNGAVAVTVSGSSNTAYNGTFPLQSTASATTIVLTYPSSPGTFSGTASEQFATIWYASFGAMPLTKIILYSPNSFTPDDFGSGSPLCYLNQTSAGSGSSCSGGFSATWTNAGCTTLAQIAQCASTVLYNAYNYFATNNAGGQDSRLFALVHQQSAGQGALASGYAVGNAPFPATVVAGVAGVNSLMQNQIHPGTYGQYLKQLQIAPYIVKAAAALLANRY